MYLYKVQKQDKISQTSTLISIDKYEKLQSEFSVLKNQYDQLLRLVYGVKSERFIGPVDQNQLNLFGQRQDENKEGAEVVEITYKRSTAKKEKKKPVRAALPNHLPRVEETIEPKIIKEGSVKIGEEVTEILEISPAKMWVRRIVRPKYVLRKEDLIQIGELPSLPIPKGNAGSSLLAHISVNKFVDHLPLYRQRQIFKRYGIKISPSTIGGWFSKSSDLLAPLYEKLRIKVINGSRYLQCDESPIKVQDNEKKGSLHKGYMWVVRNPIENLVLFEYNKGRSKNVPEKLFLNFTGTLQTDGYKTYRYLKTNGTIDLLGCMAHARRYFENSLSNDTKRAEHMLFKIQKLYAMERKAKERKIDFETRQRYRELYARPIFKKMKIWLDENQNNVFPKSLIGKAINYMLGLFENLERYIDDGQYDIDNNLIENAIRPIAIGRKNYLFAGSHDAAQNYAMMYSLFATCKINNVNPYEWLKDVFDKISDCSIQDLDKLLPHIWKENQEGSSPHAY